MDQPYCCKDDFPIKDDEDVEPVGDAPITGVPPAVLETEETPGLCRSTRERKQWKQSYIPSHTSEQKYETMLAQCAREWEDKEILHPDAHLVINMAPRDESDVVKVILTQLTMKSLTQMSMKAGQKKWGKKADKAIYKEMAQLHHRNTFKPLRCAILTLPQNTPEYCTLAHYRERCPLL